MPYIINDNNKFIKKLRAKKHEEEYVISQSRQSNFKYALQTVLGIHIPNLQQVEDLRIIVDGYEIIYEVPYDNHSTNGVLKVIFACPDCGWRRPFPIEDFLMLADNEYLRKCNSCIQDYRKMRQQEMENV